MNLAKISPVRKLSFELPGPGPDRVPPTEFRIFPFGKIDTSKGVFTFDSDAARLVLSAYKDQGNQLPLDYDHSQVEGPFPAPAAGWYDLELRDDGLWATNIKWTAKAAEFLAAAEYRYFSPAFQTDAKQRITKLINIALTNLPATKNMEPLVAASRKDHHMATKNRRTVKLDDSDTLSKFVSKRCDELHIDADELSKRMGMKTDELDELKGGSKLSKKMAGKLSKSLDVGLDSFKPWINDELDELDETTDDVDADETTDDTGDGGDGDGKDGDQGQPKGGKKDKTSSDGDVATSISIRDLVRLTGRSNKDAALSVIAGWRKAAAKAATLSDRLADLEARLADAEAEKAETEVLSMVEGGLKSGKLQRTQREWALATGRKDVETLRDYLASAIPAGPASFKEALTPRKDMVARFTETLSEIELERCRDSGIKPEDFAKTKAMMHLAGTSGISAA